VVAHVELPHQAAEARLRLEVVQVVVRHVVDEVTEQEARGEDVAGGAAEHQHEPTVERGRERDAH
jgi:hypothetical protein